jgi:hypothetical protein
MSPRLLLAFVLAQAAGLPVVACGARSELEVDETSDAGRPIDAGRDASIEDARTRDVVEEDALPPIDATPPSDASTCPTGLTAYLLTEAGALYSYDPPSRARQMIGSLNCPSSGAPWTLTAASSGLLYAVFEDWKIYEVDPATLSCTATSYHPSHLPVGTAIGVTVGPRDGGEAMFIYGKPNNSGPILAVGDLQTFSMIKIGDVLPPPAEYPLDVRADAFGRILGLSPGGTFVDVDPATGEVLAEDATTFTSAGSWALLTWDSDYYFFAGSSVNHYDLQTKLVTPYDDVGVNVVGASAAPCIH